MDWTGSVELISRPARWLKAELIEHVLDQDLAAEQIEIYAWHDPTVWLGQLPV
jgi:hypothetical protein